jgi:hypothetical protein
MPLTYNLNKIADYKNACFRTDGDLSPLTQSLIFATMPVGINQITEKNAEEFYTRLNLIERVNGTFLRTADGKDLFITPEDIRKHIGLSTNATPRTRPQFLKETVGGLMRDIGYNYRRTVEKKRKEAVA